MSIYNSQNLPLSNLKIIKKTIVSSLPISIIFFFMGLVFLISGKGSYALVSFSSGILVFVITIIYQYFYYKLYFYDFSESKAEIRKGVISRATGFVRYERLQNIYLDQDILDRIFGLYDVHYETAGETSGFYSHVDGLNKENADKLVKFLNEKSGHASIASAKKVLPKSIQTTEIGLSRENCPISDMIIKKDIITSVGFSAFLFVMVLIFISNFGFMIGPDLSYLLILYIFIIIFVSVTIISFLYTSIWYKNFFFLFDNEKGEIKSKVIGQMVSYLYYDRIQNINIKQGIIDRLFGLFSVTIETARETLAVTPPLTIRGLNEVNAQRIRDFLMAKAKAYNGGL